MEGRTYSISFVRDTYMGACLTSANMEYTFFSLPFVSSPESKVIWDSYANGAGTYKSSFGLVVAKPIANRVCALRNGLFFSYSIVFLRSVEMSIGHYLVGHALKSSSCSHGRVCVCVRFMVY